MIKSAHLYLGLAALLTFPAIVPAQDNSASLAVNEAVLRQAKAIELHTKLAEAAATAQRGDAINAAKAYQEAVTLAHEVGSIEPETQQAIAGLAVTSLALAREAQSRGDYTEADTRIKLVLNADPKNQAAIVLKMQNDQLIAKTNGHRPDAQTIETIPTVMSQKTQAGTYVQDGKLLYEMGKLDEADAKLSAAVKLDPDNAGAYYYQNLVKQARYTRDLTQHSVDTQTRMEQVEKQWVLPKSSAQLAPIANPYATNTLIYTGPGRQAIVAKLDHIRLDTVNYDGLPLSEVVRQLTEQSRLRDPNHKGIDFMINPNADQSGPAIAAAAGGGFGGGFGDRGLAGAPAPAPAAIDPATGLPAAPAPGAGAGGEKVDIGTAVTVKLSMTDVRLADVLDAIQMICEHPDGHPIKYSIQEFGVVFADKGSFETVPLFTRTFKVDPNTFYSGLESVGSSSFGGGSGQSGGGGGGGGGGGRGGGGGGGGQSQGGAVVGVVNAFAGAGGLRNQGGQGGGGGGGGGGGTGQGGGSVLQGTGAGAGGGGSQNQGGLNYITTQTLANTPSTIARAFFTALGVNLDQPAGKAVFFNDKSGLLFVKATEQDLDTIDKAIQTLNQVSPQVHIKARFIEVSQDDSKAFGFDWYLGQFAVGNQAVGTGGSSPSLTVPTSPANPLGAFPGNTVSSLVPASANDQLITGGLRNSGPTLGTLTGILTDPNFRVALHALEQRGGFETLGEPEITTMSGRQAQMRATQVVTVITDFNFQQGTGGIQQNTGGATQ